MGFKTNGLAELISDLQSVSSIPDSVQEDMLNAGADILVNAQKSMAKSLLQGTGVTAASIAKSGVTTKASGGKKIVVMPQGSRRRPFGMKGGGKKMYTTRNAEIAFINEYGSKNTPARGFIRKANTASMDAVVEAEQAVIDKYLAGKNL